ncbi:hypothetical protein PENTCL1PPCAC_9250, partial [Pristionchus entomophagus]
RMIFCVRSNHSGRSAPWYRVSVRELAGRSVPEVEFSTEPAQDLTNLGVSSLGVGALGVLTSGLRSLEILRARAAPEIHPEPFLRTVCFPIPERWRRACSCGVG